MSNFQVLKVSKAIITVSPYRFRWNEFYVVQKFHFTVVKFYCFLHIIQMISTLFKMDISENLPLHL